MPTRPALLGLVALEPREVPTAAFLDLPALPDWDADTLANVRKIADTGRALGRNPNGFIKVGDSNTAMAGYLNQYGAAGFDPTAAGLTAAAPEAIDTFFKYRTPLRTGDNSFNRTSTAAYPGWQVPNVMTRLAGEVVATNAAAAVVMIGTNDQVASTPEKYRPGLYQLVDTLTSLGVVPILCTIPATGPTVHLDDRMRTFNQIIVDVADDRNLPLYNPYHDQITLPNLGLDSGGIHLTTSPRGGGYAEAVDLAYGQNTRNLLTLKALDRFQDAAYGTPPTPAVPETPELTAWAPLAKGQPVVAVGAPTGSAPAVRLTDPATGALRATFLAYTENFTGGVRVAVGDVNGDGVSDIVTAPASGGGPHVKAFSGTDGRELFSFFAFEPSFTGGVSVAVGDADGDGAADLVLGAGAGGGPRVKVVRAADRAPVGDFMAFEPSFRGGVNVAVAGGAVVAAPGAGGGGVVKRFATTGRLLTAAEVFEPSFRGGVSLAAGDLTGDGTAEIVAAPQTGSTRVRALTTAGAEIASFYAGGSDPAGVRVAVAAGRIVTGTADRTGAVSGFDRTGTRQWRAIGSDAADLAAGPFVG